MQRTRKKEEFSSSSSSSLSSSDRRGEGEVKYDGRAEFVAYGWSTGWQFVRSMLTNELTRVLELYVAPRFVSREVLDKLTKDSYKALKRMHAAGVDQRGAAAAIIRTTSWGGVLYSSASVIIDDDQGQMGASQGPSVEAPPRPAVRLLLLRPLREPRTGRRGHWLRDAASRAQPAGTGHSGWRQHFCLRCRCAAVAAQAPAGSGAAAISAIATIAAAAAKAAGARPKVADRREAGSASLPRLKPEVFAAGRWWQPQGRRLDRTAASASPVLPALPWEACIGGLPLQGCPPMHHSGAARWMDSRHRGQRRLGGVASRERPSGLHPGCSELQRRWLWSLVPFPRRSDWLRKAG
ncbi:unnamed protein product [Phaeothamnion confervicola]